MNAPALPREEPDVPAPGEALVRTLLVASAVGEALVAVALLSFPRSSVEFLLGQPPSAEGVVLARCYGVALVALGLAWWFAARSGRSPGTSVPGYLAYNSGIGAFLLALAYSGAGNAPVLWLVSLLHLALAAVAVWSRRLAKASGYPGSGRG